MPIANCQKCGALFLQTNKPICPACASKEDFDFQKASEWLRANPGKTMTALSEATGIDSRSILRWIREQRLMYSGSSQYALCKKCGKIIDNGNLCETCKAALSSDPSQSVTASGNNKTEPKSPNSGMHYLPRERRR